MSLIKHREVYVPEITDPFASIKFERHCQALIRIGINMKKIGYSDEAIKSELVKHFQYVPEFSIYRIFFSQC